ncbi:phosphoglycerate dehydrogenase [Angustibacter luteus]|uniref:D-3-phosphoglycerate dehydrogenase n=1 Tax=Angustibacter luteus TaxID=658456 RepID=A0ABW1JB98_9ACTN
MRALLLENIHTDAAELLRASGHEVETRSGALDEDELIDALPGIDLLGIRSTTFLTEKVLAGAPQLQAVGAFCIGTNQIDLTAATGNGVAVFNAPYSNTRSVVEVTIGAIIALARRLTEKNAAMHAGIWDKSAKGSHEVRGRKLGIVGYGNIGSQLSVVAEALGMSVFFYDTEDRLAMGNARRCGSLGELLETAEVISLHVDGRPGNQDMFGEQQFATMRPRSFFMNMSRGFVVDTEALGKHIRSGHIAGAAIDVFPFEPKRQGDPFDSDLRGLPNVILTPHVGGSTQEAQQDIGRFVAGKLIGYAQGGSTSLSVNMPPIGAGDLAGSHRLAHMHRNVPGVLATVNALFAEHGVNVEAQNLSTRGDVGYLVTDVNADYTPEIVERLEQMPETIRLRVLS